MSKKEVGSAKWISNQIRKQSSKTKIRWYCGLCQVACKDENGYKCHLEHEGHIRRQMTMEDSMKEFKLSGDDKKFRKKFLDYLVSKHFGQTVLAHDLYRDIYPIDRGHNIMKTTCWGTLGVFIAHLKKEGRIEAQKGLKGWQIRVSSNDFAEEREEEHAESETKKKVKKDVSLDQKKFTQEVVIQPHTESSERLDSTKPLQFSLGTRSASSVKSVVAHVAGFDADSDSDQEDVDEISYS